MLLRGHYLSLTTHTHTHTTRTSPRRRAPECGAENQIKARDTIACRECGYRILYKRRTKRSSCCIVATAPLQLPPQLQLRAWFGVEGCPPVSHAPGA